MQKAIPATVAENLIHNVKLSLISSPVTSYSYIVVQEVNNIEKYAPNESIKKWNNASLRFLLTFFYTYYSFLKRDYTTVSR
jgi:hypothetical protein